MKVLFLLSCLEPAGSETYCVSLAKAWRGKHDIFWISDRLHFGQQPYTSLPISQKAIPGGIFNTLKVKAFIQKHGIQLIHSHSRRAHWVAAQAAALTKIPHVTTIHQPPPVHFFSRTFPCLGDATLAIDETVRRHLQKHFSGGIRRLALIRNGIDIASEYQEIAGNRVLILGRLTGGRWKTLQFLFEVLKRIGRTLPATHFQIVGRIPEERLETLTWQLAEVNRAIQPSSIETHDFVTDLPGFLRGCKAVIGGGRSALESLAAGKPVIALGEKGVIGLCRPETWDECMRTNFGDHFETAADQFYPPKLELSLRQILEIGMNQHLGHWGRTQVEKHYNSQMVAAEVDKVYSSCISPS